MHQSFVMKISMQIIHLYYYSWHEENCVLENISYANVFGPYKDRVKIPTTSLNYKMLMLKHYVISSLNQYIIYIYLQQDNDGITEALRNVSPPEIELHQC